MNRNCPLAPFALSLSKGSKGFDKLSPNGIFPMDLVEHFHYKPATTVEEGIKFFVAWYRNEFKFI